MYKTVIRLITLFIFLSLLSCGDSPKNSLSKQPKIGMAIYRFDDTFMANFKRIIEEESKDKAILSLADSHNQQAIQNNQVDTFLISGLQSLIINPVDTKAGALLIHKAQKANVPIIFINREPKASDLSDWDKAFYVGSHASDSGRMSAQILIDYWRSHPEADLNGDGILQYVILMGEPTHQDTRERTDSYQETFTYHGVKTQEILRDHAHWNRSLAQDKMRGFIRYAQNQNLIIEAVLANNDEMALGAIEALKEEGYFSNNRFIPVVGVDASVPALDSMERGELLGSPLNNTKAQAISSFEIAYAMAQGTPIELTVGKLSSSDGSGKGNYVWIPYEKVSQENYQKFR